MRFHSQETRISAMTMADVAEFYAKTGQLNKAEKLAQSARKVQERVYGENHHLVANTWMTMAYIYRAQGRQRISDEMIAKAKSSVERTGNIMAIAQLASKTAETKSITTVALK